MDDNRRNVKRKYFYWAMVLAVIFVAAGIIFLLFDIGDATDKQINTSGIFLVAAYCWVAIIYSKINESAISLFNAFLLYSCLSNAGQTILNLLGVREHWYVDVYANFTNNEIYRFLWFQTISISLMGLGAISANYYVSVKHKALPETRNNKEKYRKLLIALYFVCLISVGVSLINRVVYRMDKSYGDYTAYDFEDKFSVMWVFYLITFAALVFTNIEKSKLYLIITAVLTAICFVLGIRTYAIASLGIFLFTYIQAKKKKSKLKLTFGKTIVLVLAGYLFLCVMALITKLRMQSITIIMQNGIGELFDPIQSFIDMISETGASAACLLKTMRYIDVVGHQQTILYDILEAFIPHFILDVFSITKPELSQIGLGTWVTFHTGRLLAGKAGMGYSYLAEAFLNFGYFGALFTLIHGYFIVYLEKKAEEKFKAGYVLFPATAVFYISKQIFFARAQLALMVDPVRYIILIAIASFFITRIRIR